MMMRHISFVVVICLFAGATKINGNGIKGRLLTPEEGCGLTKVKNTRIVGGSEAPVGAWPWMAVLGYEDEKKDTKIDFGCDGSLITSRHILTAAHCISDELKLVRLGGHNLNSTNDGPHQDIPIARSIKHRHHIDMFKINDIAIIVLARDVEFSDKIRPICLPLDEPMLSRDFNGSNPFAAGWGLTTECGGDSSDVLMQLQVPLIDNKKCREKVQKISATFADIQIDDHVICAGGLGKGVWSGDSGGPLMLPVHENGTFPFYQIGIVSFAYRCATEDVPDIYTKVQHYADWIKFQVESSTENSEEI